MEGETVRWGDPSRSQLQQGGLDVGHRLEAARRLLGETLPYHVRGR